MSKHQEQAEAGGVFAVIDALSPFKSDAWKKLNPRERLARSWKMRSRLRDPQAVHDEKLFPKP
jgi:hypothetical protein